MDNITATFSSSFPTSPYLFDLFPHWIWLASGIAVAIIISVAVLFYTGSWLITVVANTAIVGLLALMRILPVWFFAISVIFGVSAILSGRGVGSGNPTTETTTFTDRFSWLRYGKRMKRAYASKFGYDNSGFNQEVDTRIEIMRTQGKGTTRTLSQDWLKRNAQFVEIPWQDISDEGSQEEAA